MKSTIWSYRYKESDRGIGHRGCALNGREEMAGQCTIYARPHGIYDIVSYNYRYVVHYRGGAMNF